MGESDIVIANMRDRIALCRRLARSITDASAKQSLLKMAFEIEADIKRLEAE